MTTILVVGEKMLKIRVFTTTREHTPTQAQACRESFLCDDNSF